MASTARRQLPAATSMPRSKLAKLQHGRSDMARNPSCARSERADDCLTEIGRKGNGSFRRSNGRSGRSGQKALWPKLTLSRLGRSVKLQLRNRLKQRIGTRKIGG